MELIGAQRKASSSVSPFIAAATKVEAKASPAPVRSYGGLGSGYSGILRRFWPSGAYASDGQKRLKMPLYPDPKPPYDRTGAGDAFASTFVAAAMKGLTLEDALRWAPINSMSVCQKLGAQAGLLTEKQLLELLHKAPAHYKPTPL